MGLVEFTKWSLIIDKIKFSIFSQSTNYLVLRHIYYKQG